MTPSAAAATVLVDELARCGVQHVVLCPGSRSAPLAYALVAADRAGSLRLHVRVDERSAAYLALGLARGSGAPAAVVTTSGTAVANLHPAVLEAHESGVPLLLLTADRPPELRGTRANQTTDQVGVFGTATRWSHDLGTPEWRVGQVATWRTVVDRAVAAATGSLGGERGPAHLNVPLREPLAPDPPAADGWPESLAGRPGGLPWTQAEAGAPRSARSAPAATQAMSATEAEATEAEATQAAGAMASGAAGPAVPGARTLVVLGDLGDVDGTRTQEILAIAARHRWPVLAEPFGTGRRERVVPHGPLALAVPHPADDEPITADAGPPSALTLLVVGRVTLSRTTAALLRTPGAQVHVVTDSPRWPDPGHVVHAVHRHEALLDGTLARQLGAGAPAWAGRWAGLAAQVHTRATAWLEADWPAGADGLPGGAGLAHAMLAALGPDDVLFVGSSNSARDLEVARGPQGPVVVANRGLAGIDGCLATAAGIALARPGTATYALVGDLTFLHDANALAIGPGEPVPDLTVVVADDDGGGIFATLEYGEPARRAGDPDGYERIFATPTGTDLVSLAAAHGVPSTRITSREQLGEELRRPPRGLRVLHVPIRRDHRRTDADALRAAVAASVRGSDADATPVPQ